MDEKRRFKRFSSPIDVLYYTDNGVKQRVKKVRNISTGGISFFNDEKLPKNTDIKLEIICASNISPIKTTARVGWTEEIPSNNGHKNQYIVGMIFENKDAYKISDCIKTI